MIAKSTIVFLKNLRENNHKEWFDDHKKDYQQARTNFLDFVNQLIMGIAEFDREIAQSNLDPKKTIMRINRDIRFSKDKTPYKTNFFTFINKAGKKSPFGGYYFSLSPEDSFYGGGIYMPENSILNKIRQEIDYQLNEWKGIVDHPDLTRHFGEVKASGKLSRPPKGYDKENPAIEWIKYKGYYTQKMLQEPELLDPQLLPGTLEAYRSVKPLVDFINRGIE
jgi:uncharacterized protein (TIGR02453 family)